MARKKNATFTGVGIRDTDRGAPTFTRMMENAAGDQALIADKLTGANGETPINHNGAAGRGALLGIPIVNQYIGRSLTNSAGGGSGKDGGEDGETNILAVPLFVPPGEERELVVELFMKFIVSNPAALQMRVVVLDTSNVEVVSVPLRHHDFALGISRSHCRLSLPSSGLHLLFVRLTQVADPPTTTGTGYDIPIGRLISWSVRPDRIGPPSSTPARMSTQPYSLWTPSASQGFGYRELDAAMFTDLRSANAYVMSALALNLNGLIEYTTRWPAGGQSVYIHEDHDGAAAPDSTNPARSRFHAGTASLYATEGRWAFPLWCEAFGSFKTDGGLTIEAAEPPTIGMLDWFAPIPRATALQTVRRLPIMWPDFDTGTSNLKIAVLLGSDGFTDLGTDWTISIDKAAGAQSLGTITAVGSSASNLWLAQLSAATFSPDTQDTISLRTQKTSGALEAMDQICLLGWCGYFEP